MLNPMDNPYDTTPYCSCDCGCNEVLNDEENMTGGKCDRCTSADHFCGFCGEPLADETVECAHGVVHADCYANEVEG